MARPEVTGRKTAATRPEPTASVVGGSSTIPEFCHRNRISVQLFYKRPDLMPDTFYVGSRRLVGNEAEARWRAEREVATASDAST